MSNINDFPRQAFPIPDLSTVDADIQHNAGTLLTPTITSTVV
jgi:hypothetical protein